MIEFSLVFKNTEGEVFVNCSGVGKALKVRVTGTLYPAQLGVVNIATQGRYGDQQ